MTTATLAILGYVALQFAVGAWVSRRITTERDYILAGRTLSVGLVAFSVFATWFGAEAIQVSAGEIYEHGLAGALVDPIGYGVAVIIVGLALAAPLWRRNITTFADMIRERYSPTVEKMFVLVLLPGSLFWASAQIRAFGQILSASSSLDVSTAIFIAGAFVAAYSVIGGLLADSITDVVQGLVVIVGLVVLTAFVAAAAGGLGASLQGMSPERLAFVGDGDNPLGRVEKIAVTLCGSIVSIELISRFLGARSASVARSGTLIGGGLYLVVGLIPIFLGLVGPTLMPDIKDSEQIVPKLAEAYLPAAAYAVFLGALVSAILSVVHAALHAPAAQISHNIIGRLQPDASPRARLWNVRLSVLALSVLALLLAHTVDRIKDLVEIASAFGSAGAFVVAVFGLYTSFGGPRAAAAALVVGITTWGAGRLTGAVDAPYVLALLSALVAYVIIGLFEREISAAPEAQK
jgi:Na+/proline symporter